MNIYELMFFLLVVFISLTSCNQSAQKPIAYGNGIAYEQINYGGQSFPLTAGSHEPDILHPEEWYFGDPKEIKGRLFVNTISSIRIGTGLKCEFYQMSISKVISLVLLEKAITQTLRRKDGKKKLDRYNAIR